MGNVALPFDLFCVVVFFGSIIGYIWIYVVTMHQIVDLKQDVEKWSGRYNDVLVELRREGCKARKLKSELGEAIERSDSAEKIAAAVESTPDAEPEKRLPIKLRNQSWDIEGSKVRVRIVWCGDGSGRPGYFLVDWNQMSLRVSGKWSALSAHSDPPVIFLTLDAAVRGWREAGGG